MCCRDVYGESVFPTLKRSNFFAIRHFNTALSIISGKTDAGLTGSEIFIKNCNKAARYADGLLSFQTLFYSYLPAA